MVSLVKYSKIDFSKIKLHVPKKINGVYTSEMNYSESQFMIQTPVLDINYISEKWLTSSVCKEFKLFFNKLTENLVTLLHTNSKDFFGGKEFSIERLNESLEPLIISEDSSDTCEINNITLGKDVKITNVLNEIILPIYPIKGKCVLHLKNVTFHGKQFKLNIEVKVIKIEYKKRLNHSVLLDLESESEEEKVESEIENLENEEIKVKIDSLDFFD